MFACHISQDMLDVFPVEGALVALMVKNLPADAGDLRDTGSIPGLGRSLGGGHGNPLQYSCLENPHGQRSLAGYSPWGHKALDVAEQLSTQHSKTSSRGKTKLNIC